MYVWYINNEYLCKLEISANKFILILSIISAKFRGPFLKRGSSLATFYLDGKWLDISA
jgi:hypothetical protein